MKTQTAHADKRALASKPITARTGGPVVGAKPPAKKPNGQAFGSFLGAAP